GGACAETRIEPIKSPLLSNHGASGTSTDRPSRTMHLTSTAIASSDYKLRAAHWCASERPARPRRGEETGAHRQTRNIGHEFISTSAGSDSQTAIARLLRSVRPGACGRTKLRIWPRGLPAAPTCHRQARHAACAQPQSPFARFLSIVATASSQKQSGLVRVGG